MTSHNGPSADPLSLRGLVAGVAAGAAAWTAAAFLDSLHHGDPATGLLLLLAPAVVPVATLVYGLLGWPVYARLRRAAPARDPARLLYVAAVVAPLVLAECLIVTVWIDALTSYSGRADNGAAFIARPLQAAEHYWREMLLMAICGGPACWCADRAPLLWSRERGRRRRARVTASVLAASVLTPLLAFLLANQYVVIHRAKAIAGARPYCLLVPTTDDRAYKTATKRWQLSSWQMRATYELLSGTRGGMYVSNHALLVLDGPREYLNWSYWSENFRHDALIGGSLRDTEPRGFQPCAPKPDFGAGLR